jgi:EAL and modified HD-GYP domain-containing signal transduction protein
MLPIRMRQTTPMNAPEKVSAPIDLLGSVWICYAPLIDKKRKAIGTRLTILSAHSQARPPIGSLLVQLNDILPESSVPVLVAMLDAEFDESALEWQAPRNTLLEIPAQALLDPKVQGIAQALFRDGKRLVLRGRPSVPLPPALISCFEYAIIHVSEDRRRFENDKTEYQSLRRIPFIVTGVQSVADAIEAFDREAAACVGWPLEDQSTSNVRPLQPGQAVVLELLRLVRDDADIGKIDSTLRRDPALAFKLLRLVNSAAFNLPVQITSFQHAVMMLGYKKLIRWLSLLLATASKDSNTFPLMHASIRRGIFLETIGASSGQGDVRDELFITGAFSLLDRITGAPFPHLFELISLSESIVDAIRDRSGPYGPYLDLIESIERSDPIGVRKHAEKLAIPIARCNQALLQALAAAQLLDGDL